MNRRTARFHCTAPQRSGGPFEPSPQVPRPAGRLTEWTRQRFVTGRVHSERRWREICEGSTLRLSQQDSFALAQVANNRCVGSANSSFVNWRPVFSRQAARLDNIFHSKRNRGQLPLSGWSLRQHLDPGVNGGVHVSNAIQAWL